MIATVRSKELTEILNSDSVLASRFDWKEGFDTVYVSIRNVVDVLDIHGLQLTLSKEGNQLVIQTAEVKG